MNTLSCSDASCASFHGADSRSVLEDTFAFRPLPSRYRRRLKSQALMRLHGKPAAWKLLLPLVPLGCALLFLFDPARTSLFPPCPFKLATGLDCPGCGTLRAAHELLRGNPATAFGLNPLSVIALPVVLGLVVWNAVRVQRGRPAINLPVPDHAPWTVGGLLLAYGVARNLPWAAFSWMSSG